MKHKTSSFYLVWRFKGLSYGRREILLLFPRHMYRARLYTIYSYNVFAIFILTFYENNQLFFFFFYCSIDCFSHHHFLRFFFFLYIPYFGYVVWRKELNELKKKEWWDGFVHIAVWMLGNSTRKKRTRSQFHDLWRSHTTQTHTHMHAIVEQHTKLSHKT